MPREIIDRHVVRKQKPLPVKDIIANLKARLAVETDAGEIDYLNGMIVYWEGEK